LHSPKIALDEMEIKTESEIKKAEEVNKPIPKK
jgi:hypothetical protein